MTKRIFSAITVFYIFGAFLGLVVLNSFFHENSTLLHERNRVDQLNKVLTKENRLLRKAIPSVPKGAIIEGMRVAPDPESADTATPKYVLSLWIKNPTKAEIPGVRGIVYVQGTGGGGHLDAVPVGSPSVGPGQRRLFSTHPIPLGAPGEKVEIVASLWDQPGVVKLVFTLPSPKPAPADSAPNDKDNKDAKDGQDGKSVKDAKDKSAAGNQPAKTEVNDGTP